MMDELPMLATLKDQKWMARLPRSMFPKAKKSPRNNGNLSPNDSSDTDGTLLSPGFLPTPRSARAMSVLVPKTDDEILDALDPRFFTESFDPTSYMLDNIPDSADELNRFLRTEISAVDVAKDVILAKLKDEVRANYNSLIQGMKVVQDVDLDLVRAQIHVDICVGLRKGLSRKEFEELTILDDIRLRMQDFIPKLRKQFDQSLRKVAKCFDPLGYKELLQAYIALADHSENLGFEFSSYTLNEVLSNIPEIIVRSIDDMTKDFVRHVFEAGSQKKFGEDPIADEINAGEILLQSSVLIYPTSADSGKAEQPQNAPMSRKVTLRRVSRYPVAVEDADENNLYASAERSIACEAIIGQCRLLNAIEELARSYLPDRYLCLMDEVFERNRTMARELRSFMYTTIATSLVDVPVLLDSIAAVSWNIPYISDQHNEYVVHLVRKCGEAWGGLEIMADGSIPMDSREDIWAAMVQTIMDTLLQGFSTVSKPTPQGRALMLLDLHALQNGLDLINHISSRTVPRGREFVGNYIKAFYYDQDELLEWVQTNKTQYSKVQFANLLKNGIGSTLEIKNLRELVLKIDAILS
ncbi:hypothetical protein BBO99_00007105 [Phytophthora kernoviae]|uniref:Syndetin C-terminal domain-containing protein n=2 Tax=Phytophthora kernoviae TaxID=325452 RepID=A0A3R7GT33_9STRA|nr:hypothetical protein G195_007625 [Phytophthora kernoviae 00238/432]KAG2520723.1 hypothetical protein JM16_005872 [Phytophthora kernoviae]KAG2521846.1 hypothetical protein JM18_006420 [Phytophthora kernoviae]RLN37777.1 hypothetical protein BBI17_007070 [Phytophthora kernoviae]RLN76991.1 hypothetical protein BBO99_00007105 [Phytophthora kernoviae]